MKSEFLYKLGYRLAQIRKLKNLSQEDLEDISGISTNSISKIECGKTNVGIETLNTIADALKIDLSQLISDTIISPVMYSPIIERLVERLNHDDVNTLKFFVDQIHSLLKFKKGK